MSDIVRFSGLERIGSKSPASREFVGDWIIFRRGQTRLFCCGIPLIEDFGVPKEITEGLTVVAARRPRAGGGPCWRVRLSRHHEDCIEVSGANKGVERRVYLTYAELTNAYEEARRILRPRRNQPLFFWFEWEDKHDEGNEDLPSQGD